MGRTSTASSEEFTGSARFAVRRKLGAGGMGIVYAVLDRERGVPVALKTLRRFDGAALYRFKQEFRALADVNHPNLVALHELINDGERWFFTMELVDGFRFTDYINQELESAIAETQPGLPQESDAKPRREFVRQDRLLDGTEPSRADEAKLKRALVQLSAGLTALHQADKLHRDIKPSNVLVTHKGRVVILDFGLATELSAQRKTKLREQFVAGTAEYMAPEQAAGLPLSPASDWYSVGVMIYECLTGVRPHRGDPRSVLIEKQRRDPMPPSTLVSNVPADLEELCMALLHRDPMVRPDGDDIVRQLGSDRRRLSMVSWSYPSTDGELPLVGRDRHMATLELSFSDVQQGRPTTVFVHGSSGMGKTTLVRSFLERVRERGDAFVFLSRCHERESVPYKAVDGLVDDLSRHLLRLPLGKMQEILPVNMNALARLFPVLLEVCALVDVPADAHLLSPDPNELRLKGFNALKILLARLSAEKPVVLFVDDLHWGDGDSAALIAHLMRPPETPRVCLVACYRTEETAVPALVERMIGEDEPSGAFQEWRDYEVRIRELEVEPISRDESFQLALGLLTTSGPHAMARATDIVDEARGNPFFVQELARHAKAQIDSAAGSASGVDTTSSISLEAVLAGRLAQLPKDARHLLELISVAGRPVAQGLILRSAGQPPGGRVAINVLRSTHFVRTRGASDGDAIEVYHDRIRHAVIGALEARHLASRHAALAVALQQSGEGDAETLAHHFRGAGQPVAAAGFAEQAAANAARALAFDQAARLYRLTIELHADGAVQQALSAPTGGVEPALQSNSGVRDRARLQERLAASLANAGRGADSAQAYLEAAKGAQEAEARELRRRGAEQLLRSGRVDEGLEVLRAVLEGVGLELARTPQQALRSLLTRRAQLRLRGIKFVEKDVSEIPPAELTRIDTCRAVAAGLSTVDNIRGADFQTRHLLLALKAGEPYRIARALATEAAYAANAGGPGSRRAKELLESARKLAERIRQPHALGLVEAIEGIVAYEEGRYAAARRHLETAELTFRERNTGVHWELETSQLFGLMSLAHLGQLSELDDRVSTLLEEAQARGDIYADTNFSIGYPNLAWLIRDNPEGARRVVVDALKRWSRQGFNAQHYYALLANAHIDLYTGDGSLAFLRMRDNWPAMSRSLLLRVQFLRIEALWLRSRAALAAAMLTTKRQRTKFLGSAEADAKRIARERMRWSDPIVDLLMAGVLVQRGDSIGAIRHLRDAIDGLRENDMALCAAIAKRRLGNLLDDDEGAALRIASDRFMQDQGVRNPARLADVFAPGF